MFFQVGMWDTRLIGEGSTGSISKVFSQWEIWDAKEFLTLGVKERASSSPSDIFVGKLVGQCEIYK